MSRSDELYRSAREAEKMEAYERKLTCTNSWEKSYYDMYPDDPVKAEREMTRAMNGM